MAMYLSPGFIVAVLVSTVQYTSGSHCTLKFEGLSVGYGLLSIILVIEKKHFWVLERLKVHEKSLIFVLCICCEPCI